MAILWSSIFPKSLQFKIFIDPLKFVSSTENALVGHSEAALAEARADLAAGWVIKESPEADIARSTTEEGDKEFG